MTQQSRGTGTDPIGDLQRWLVRSGARGVGRELGGHLRSALGMGQVSGDVWKHATAGPPPGEAPECAWCPVCRAARMVRESRPGLVSHMAAAGDALASVMQEAVSVVEAALAATGRGAGEDGWRPAAVERDPGEEPAAAPPGEGSPHEPDDRG